MSVIIQNKGFVVKMEDGICHWHFYTGELNLKDYKEAYDYGMEHKELWPFLILATHDQGFHFSSEAWNFMIDKNTDFSFISANALVIR